MKRERAKGMLHTTATPSEVAKQFRCHVRMIGRLKNRFQQTWTTSDRPRPGRPRVLTRRQDRVTCAIDFIWRQSQLGHTQETIIQESALKL